MCINHGFRVVEMKALLIALILMSMIFQANASDNPQSNATGADDALAAAESDTSGINNNTQGTFAFPRWPERDSAEMRDVVPMAPPGPYMSSALSDFSFDDATSNDDWDKDIERIRSERDRMREERDREWEERDRMWEERDRKRDEMWESDTRSIERFNPDAPWPSNNTDAPSRWMPEDGYHFVDNDAQVEKMRQEAVQRNYPPGYYGYQRPPMMNWPAPPAPGVMQGYPAVNGVRR
jgi:hypothetical protein